MIRLILSLCILVVSTGTASADSYTMSLKDAIEMAMDKSNLTRAAGYSAEAARQGIAIASSRYYPSVSFVENFTISNSPTRTFMMKLDEGRFTQSDFLINNLNNPDTSHDFNTAFTLRQPIYNPITAPARDMAILESGIQETRSEAAKQEVAFRVFKLFLAIQKSRARLKAVEKAVSDAQEHMRLAGVRNQNGVGLRSDELRARTHLSVSEQHLVTARNDLAIARMELAHVIGLKESDSVDISETSITAVPLDQTQDQLINAAMENRSELKVSKADLDKADSALRLSRNSYLPSLDGFASYQLNSRDTPFRSDNESWVAGAALNWQLFDGFRRNREYSKAVAEKSAAAELLEHARRESGLRVRESVMRSEEMGKRLEVAVNALQNAEETVRLLARRFENSLATMVELLDAQTALNSTRADLVDSEAQFALSRGYVYFTAGIFIREMTK